MYENETYENILKRTLDRVATNIDKREGSLIMNAAAPISAEHAEIYMLLDGIIRNGYADTADREYLILRCKERGILPYAATQAILKGKFNMEIPLNSRFNSGELNYIATVFIESADGYFYYQLKCETAGTDGNKNFGELYSIEYIHQDLEGNLIELLIPAEDEESTEDLRERYLSSFEEKAFGGNVRDYIEKVNALPGVGKSKVKRIWNGDISPSQMIPIESVKIWYENTIGKVEEKVAAWLELVYTAAKEKKLTTGGTVLVMIINSDFDVASEALIESVQEAIDPEENAGEGYGIAPIGHIVTVQGAKGVLINIKINITFETGYDWNNLQGKIDEAIAEYLLGLRKVWAESPFLVVRVSQIESRILGLFGVIDVQGTTINGAADNLTLGAYEIPIYGGTTT